MNQSSRMDISEYSQLAPTTSAALLALGKAVDDSGLDKTLTELLKLRVSQINGCAYCVQLHLNLARKLAIAPAKLDMLVAWKESGVFTPLESAALGWAEALTLMAGKGVADGVYAEVASQFNRSEIAFLTATIAGINAWNRIAGSLHYTPPASNAA